MIEPIRDFVAVLRPDENTKTSSGLYLAPSSDDKILVAEVVAVGNGHFTSSGQPVKLTVSKGDKIAFNKTMAVELRLEDKIYLLIREENILCIIK